MKPVFPSNNALKLTYSNVAFKIFLVVKPMITKRGRGERKDGE